MTVKTTHGLMEELLHTPFLKAADIQIRVYFEGAQLQEANLEIKQ